MSNPAATIVHVVALHREAQDIVSFELARPDGGELPPPSPGAHIDVLLDSGLLRQYSLVRWQRTSYTVAVKREARSRGGSRHMCDVLRIGDVLHISAPRNAFRLDEGFHQSVLLAGGIGITPLLSMAHRLDALEREWTLYYAARHATTAAFSDELRGFGRRVVFSFEALQQGRFKLHDLVRQHGPTAHYYACGPASLLADFEQATYAIPPAQLHVERFEAIEPQEGDRRFTATLARSGREIQVGESQTLLDALLAAGIPMPHSCQQGICGQCEVPVLAGQADHRDQVLSESEKAANVTMMVCCSRACGPTITLDI